MVIIRPALDEDIAGVSVLAARLVRYHHQLDPLRFLWVDGVEEGYRQFLMGEMRSGDVVIVVAVREAETAQRIVGYTYSGIEPRNWNQLLDRCGKIHDVFVAEEERGHGIARRLVTETIRRLEELGIPRIIVNTAAQNVEAQALFASFGFRVTMAEMARENTRPRRSTLPPAI